MPSIFDILVKKRIKLAGEDRSWPGIKKRLLQKDYALIEIQLMKEFNRSLLVEGSIVEIEGFVTRIRGRQFILRPSLGVLDKFVICECDGIKIPSDYDFVRVTGYRKNVTLKNNVWFRDYVVVVDKVERIFLPQDHLKPEISFSEASDLLLHGYVDAEFLLKSSMLLSLISSPKDRFRSIGGLTTAIMPIKETFSRSISVFLDDVKRMIPKDLSSEMPEKISTRNFGKIDVIPFSWGIYNVSSAKIETDQQRVLVSRISSRFALNERTIGIAASSVAPETLNDVWIKKTDFPLPVGDSLDRYGDVKGYNRELAKFLITVHTNQPIVSLEIEEEFEKDVSRSLKKLRRKYDSEGYSGLIDLNFDYGNPRSILHISKALARADGSEYVKDVHVKEATNQFIDSLEYAFEVWFLLRLLPLM